MLRKLWEFITAALTLARDIEESRQEIKEVREELHRLSLAVVQLQGALTALAQHEADQRENMMLRLQLEQKKLPPRPESEDAGRRRKK